MITLGLACWGQHESAAVLVRDGCVLAAAEQERFSRRKFDASLPVDAIMACLESAGLEARQVARVGFYWQPWRHLGAKALHVARHAGALRELLEGKGRRHLRLLAAPAALARAVPGLRGRPFRFLPHHDCHAASAFLTSPYDEATVVSVDGAGEWTSAWWGRGRGGHLERLGQVLWPHSLGHLYAALTEYLGFARFADEYKVMGLAAYGDPGRYRADLRELVRLRPSGGFTLALEYFDYPRRDGRMVSARFLSRFGPARAPTAPLEARHRDLAAALQERLEQALAHLVSAARGQSGAAPLCLAGGVALNGVAVGRLLRAGLVERLHVPPAASDAGSAMGAALLAGGVRGPALASAALGPAADPARVASVMVASGGWRCVEPAREAAAAIAAGRVVGWYEGRMEFGARALGHRSILADPRDPEMKDRVNARVKFREGFRPFAPSILEEQRAGWFTVDHPSPFMNVVLPFRPVRRAQVPAVVHADGTGRLHTVTAAASPRYHELLQHFFAQTGVPLVLNTSFNVQGEPIVNTPEEALACFHRAGLDTLFMDGWRLDRAPS